ncbi:unnamed protein product, partial [Prorocentrum cordatum]
MLPPAAALPPGAGELPLRAYSAVASSSRLAVASANPAGALPLAVLAADCRLSCSPGHFLSSGGRLPRLPHAAVRAASTSVYPKGLPQSLHGQGSLRREPDRPCSSRSQRGAAAVMQGWWSAACAYSGPQGRLLYGARSPRVVEGAWSVLLAALPRPASRHLQLRVVESRAEAQTSSVSKQK